MLLDATSPDAVHIAARTILQGGLVAFPTETVYGLGALALDEAAVGRVFLAKRRPASDPLIVHIHDRSQLGRIAVLDPISTLLTEEFWPGPLTLVLPKHPDVPDIVTSGLPHVAVRIPSHPLALELLAAVGAPVVAPSANPFGRLSPTTAAHVLAGLGDAADLILDGGPTPIGIESTVVRVSDGCLQLLRPGAITAEMIADVTGSQPHSVREARPSSPGQMESHYAPSTPVLIADGELDHPERAGLLTLKRREGDDRYKTVIELAPDGDLGTAARRLFEALHLLDETQCDLIVVRPFPETGLGEAIMDRLRRAAAANTPDSPSR